MLIGLIQGRQESWEWHAANIANVIRSAENDALERAAEECDDLAFEASGISAEEWAFKEAAKFVRNLKSKEA